MTSLQSTQCEQPGCQEESRQQIILHVKVAHVHSGVHSILLRSLRQRTQLLRGQSRQVWLALTIHVLEKQLQCLRGFSELNDLIVRGDLFARKRFAVELEVAAVNLEEDPI
jgi:hypothetical protein